MNLKNIMFKCICIIFIINLITFNVNSVKADELDTSVEDKINLSIGSINIEKFESNQEISVPITINNAKSLCGGTLYIECFGNLTYMGTENEDSNFMVAAKENFETGAIIISFSGSKEVNGNINLVNLKFKLPEKVDDEKNYILSFGEDTSILTLDTEKYQYELKDGQVYIKEGNTFSKNDIIKLVAISAGAIILLVILLILIGKIKSKRR